MATDDDEIAASARRDRGHGLVAGGPDVDVLRSSTDHAWDEPRAALALAGLRRLEHRVAARRELTRRYRAMLKHVPGVTLLFDDPAVERSSCYVMPVLVPAARRGAVRRALREQHGVQTSVLYPAAHQFSAYRALLGDTRLPRTEECASRVVCVPLHPGLTRVQQDRVVAALAAELTAA